MQRTDVRRFFSCREAVDFVDSNIVLYSKNGLELYFFKETFVKR